MLKIREHKGITLISLIVTIIVLLILASVTISQITGSENAMEKATEAREKNEQGAELEQIKLAVVNSVASDLTGLVKVDNLKNGLNGIVEDEGRLAINKNNSPWQVIGKTGKTYEISKNGNVEVVTGVILSTKNLTLEIKDDTYGEETITARLVDIDGSLTWTASPEIIDVTTSADGMSATIKAVSSGNAKIIVECSTGDKTECNVIVKEVSNPKRGDYIILGSAIDEIGETTNEDDWKILYFDNTNHVLYAMLSDYLPNNTGVATSAGLTLGTGNKSTYGVCSSQSIADLQARLHPQILDTDSEHEKNIKNQASLAWKSLIYSSISSYDGVEVFGALSKETLLSIYSNNYPLANSVDLKDVHGCSGYWTISQYDTSNLYIINSSSINSGVSSGYKYANGGVCPIVILPTSLKFDKKSNGVWEVVIPDNT